MIYLPFLIIIYVVPTIYCASLRQGLLQQEICQTKECYDAANQIRKWMNLAFKPCEDFYEFSCGYWHNPGDTSENKEYKISLGSRGGLLSSHLKTFLDDEHIASENRLFGLLKKFLDLCLDEDSIESRGVSPAVAVLRETGGWPVLEENWSEDTWSLQDTEIAFGGSFFTINLNSAINNTWSLIVEHKSNAGSTPTEDLPKGFEKDTVKEYLDKKCQFAEAFGASKYAAEKEMKDVVEFEIALAKLMLDLNETYDDAKMVTFSEFQEEFTLLDWAKVFQSLMPIDETLTENVPVIVMEPGFLKEIGNFINKYPKRTVANYMMWNAAVSMTKFLPKNIRNIISTDISETKTRYDECVEIIDGSSLAGAAASYIAMQTLNDTNAATEITKNLLEELLKDVSELEWLDETTRTSALKTLKETKLNISFPVDLLDPHKVEEIYTDVEISSSNFFEAALESERWVKIRPFKKLGMSSMSYNLQDEIESALQINAYYLMGTKAIVVTAGFLHFLPLFNPKIPAYINYGHLGAIVAHELTHALDFQTDENNYRIYNVLNRWGSNETEDIYEEKKQCFIDQYSSMSDSKYTGKMLNGNTTQREDVADNGGLKLALRAYRKLTEKLGVPEPRLPTLEQFSPEQLFFISLANSMCETIVRERRDFQLEHDSHTPFEFRVKGMVMNSPDFSNLFDCEINDPMNPEEKCEVW